MLADISIAALVTDFRVDRLMIQRGVIQQGAVNRYDLVVLKTVVIPDTPRSRRMSYNSGFRSSAAV